MCAGSPRAPPCSPRRAVCVGGGKRAGRRRLGHISMTPVTEPLWVFKRLPRDSWAPLRLLLITPDLVKPPDLKHSARDCQLNLTLCVSGLLGMILFCSLVLAFSYVCLFFLGPYCVRMTGCHDGQFCLRCCRVSCRHAPDELATLLAMPFLIFFLL